MPSFYFDYHFVESGGARIEDPDDTGVELADHTIAQREAAAALVEFARDVFPSLTYSEVGIQVRDRTSCLYRFRIVFEVADTTESGRR